MTGRAIYMWHVPSTCQTAWEATFRSRTHLINDQHIYAAQNVFLAIHSAQICSDPWHTAACKAKSMEIAQPLQHTGRHRN